MENVYKESRKHIEIAKSAFRKTKEKKLSKLEDNFLRKKTVSNQDWKIPVVRATKRTKHFYNQFTPSKLTMPLRRKGLRGIKVNVNEKT